MEMERRTGRLVVCAPAARRGKGGPAHTTRHSTHRTRPARRDSQTAVLLYRGPRARQPYRSAAPRPASSHLTRLTCSLKTLLETSLD